MTYKILNYIFGWDYVYWEEGEYRKAYGTSRIFVAKDGRRVFWQKIEKGGPKKLQLIKRGQEVVWLTCPPEKYFPIKEEESNETERKES